ncbi:MAG: hypothetical protein CMQ61_04405 [Gammaproteobacteria bacterium]|nr:hypothetical protein [Gammaproteobacteria bacterium]
MSYGFRPEFSRKALRSDTGGRQGSDCYRSRFTQKRLLMWELAKGPLQEESDGIVERDHNPFVECCG